MNRDTQKSQRKLRLPKGFRKKAKTTSALTAAPKMDVVESNEASCQTRGCGCGN
ncbi:MAG: hypothetical protein L7R83_03865 [Candidatus Poseidonia sp.]|nr:hypothetical protein [Poseidonia sp.]